MTPRWSFFVLRLLFSLQSPAVEMSTSFRATGSIPSIDNMAMVSTRMLVRIWSGSFATRLRWRDCCCHSERSSSTGFSPGAATNQANPIGICDFRLILSKQNAPWHHQWFFKNFKSTQLIDALDGYWAERSSAFSRSASKWMPVVLKQLCAVCQSVFQMLDLLLTALCVH